MTILFCLVSNIGQAQSEIYSKHEFSFYNDEVINTASNTEIFVISNSMDTVKAIKKDGFYLFPILDTNKNFTLQVKTNDIVYSEENLLPWMLNKGSDIILGKITRLNNLISVAQRNGMTKNDIGYEACANRFFILDRTYTIDIKNRETISELRFLILNPNNSRSYSISQKIVK